MRGKRKALLSLLVFTIRACYGQHVLPIDTSKSIRIDGFWATPKNSFGNFEGKVSGDTLQLVSCEEYIYSPFGQIKSRADLKTSSLKNFQIMDTKENDGGQISFIQILKLDSDKLILFFDTDKEASKESYVLKGEIFDNRVKFDNGIKIGMNIDDFYKTFFDLFPKELSSKFKVVTISSCVDAITHIYDFKNGTLDYVKF